MQIMQAGLRVPCAECSLGYRMVRQPFQLKSARQSLRSNDLSMRTFCVWPWGPEARFSVFPALAGTDARRGLDVALMTARELRLTAEPFR